ncbi:MAG: cysteine--tRNA ligase [Limnochordia bacterium]|jgi:cysteinyl-tRNA synthetase|nr:cysteine--tRNA ligase [Limnochordia bacterium]MDI9465916.1 cysteine--tRNA ligase [Bacillota bacterium]NLO96391.1 cysteine--tRNA ligase [Bacillota bacterium]HAI51668.1 cysteine--tRNA ligase [Bacillota bacterium]HOB41460.1 cysteine--tRNA ligase [Limnochordia bacterium]
MIWEGRRVKREIRVYNTLTQEKEVFVPREPGKVSVYVCGVTPYADTHLGHARPSVVWDVIIRFLRHLGYETLHVQNFTDVDDKIIQRSLEEGVPALEISKRYIKEYLASMDALGVQRADYYPKVSEHIEEIIKLIQGLVDKGHAYAVEGDVFFSVASFAEYGKLSKQKLEELREGTRFEVDPKKRDAADFALWKAAKPGEPAWDSPWGRGRPGWHIECSAMSLKYLGEEFDFHGGGNDLIFPHHENEIAQSEAATGRPLARYWVHSGMITLKDTKMSKSLGNIVSLKRLLEEYPPALLRFYLLSTHYRSSLEYYEGKLEEMKRGWSRLNEAARKLREDLAEAQEGELTAFDQETLDNLERYADEVVDALSDDFNTAMALGVLFDVVREINSYKHKGGFHRQVLQKGWDILQLWAGEILGVLELGQQRQEGLTDGLMELILAIREELRRERNFALADRIRDQLAELGVVVEDTPQGPRWKV